MQGVAVQHNQPRTLRELMWRLCSLQVSDYMLIDGSHSGLQDLAITR